MGKIINGGGQPLYTTTLRHHWREEEKIVVTRHPALVEYLRETGVISDDTPVLLHATPDDIRGKHVIGILPLSLAALADKVTEIPLSLTPEMRGRELSLEEVREIAESPVTYKVTQVDHQPQLMT